MPPNLGGFFMVRSYYPSECHMTHVFFCVSKNVSVSCAYTQGKREQFSGFNRTLDAINNVFRKFSAFHDETGRLNVDGMNIISNDGSNKLNRSRKDRKSGSAGMPRPISYAVFCLKKKKNNKQDDKWYEYIQGNRFTGLSEQQAE